MSSKRAKTYILYFGAFNCDHFMLQARRPDGTWVDIWEKRCRIKSATARYKDALDTLWGFGISPEVRFGQTFEDRKGRDFMTESQFRSLFSYKN